MDPASAAALVAAVKADWRKAPLAAVDRALCQFADKLTKTPGEMQRADVEALRKAGLDDRAIHDAVQVISYFNYINRVADALGTDPEDFYPPRPPKTGSGAGADKGGASVRDARDGKGRHGEPRDRAE